MCVRVHRHYARLCHGVSVCLCAEHNLRGAMQIAPLDYLCVAPSPRACCVVVQGLNSKLLCNEVKVSGQLTVVSAGSSSVCASLQGTTPPTCYFGGSALLCCAAACKKCAHWQCARPLLMGPRVHPARCPLAASAAESERLVYAESELCSLGSALLAGSMSTGGRMAASQPEPPWLCVPVHVIRQPYESRSLQRCIEPSSSALLNQHAQVYRIIGNRRQLITLSSLGLDL